MRFVTGTRRQFLAAAAGVVLAACTGAGAPATAATPPQQQAESAAFVVTLGRDTVAVERYTRTADRLRGEVVGRSPRAVHTRYDARLRPDGSISHLEMTSRLVNAPAGTPETRSTVEMGVDSARVTIVRGDSTRTMQTALPAPPLPLVSNSYAMYEQALMQFRRAGVDSLGMVLVVPGNPRTFALALRRVGVDSVTLTNIAGLQRVRADERGRLLGLSGLESTQKFVVERLNDLDVAALAAEFGRREAAGEGVGQLSPRDSAVAEVGGARVSVNYGRPAKRGRRIMGEVVPWNQVWRTGANQATHFTTDRDLMVGSAHVPAGTYTLWTLPSPSGWKLIINRQTGQWGTEYDPARDLARVDMQVGALPEPVELFTISILPSGGGGTLHMAWDDTAVSVPFVVH